MPTCEDTMAGSVSVNHLLDGRCHVNPDPTYCEVHAKWMACSELLKAVRCKESAKALWRVADGEKDLLIGWSVVLATLWSTSRLSTWVQNATQAEWWQFAPSFYSRCTRVSVKTRWNSGPKSQQVIYLEIHLIQFCIQQIFSHDIFY